ncbi:MAG: hypothetical protein Q4D02_00255 [Clostridia bacterium]|nr:hypothetical protein [Clostridia bacterium]
MKLQSFQECMNHATKKIHVSEEQLIKLSAVFEPIPVGKPISKEMDKTCIEIVNQHGTNHTFVDFSTSNQIICTCFMNGFPLCVISIKNILYTPEELRKQCPDYKAVGEIKDEKVFPITLLWANDKINIDLATHSVAQLGIIADLDRYLAIKENLTQSKIESHRITINSNSPLLGNRKTRRQNKKNRASQQTDVIKNTLIISLPDSDLLEDITMKEFNIKKRTVKAHKRTLKNGIVKEFPEKTYYKVV